MARAGGGIAPPPASARPPVRPSARPPRPAHLRPAPSLPRTNKQPPPTTNSTVADGTCQFPGNFFGCESAAAGLNNGGVRFLKEDREIECEGKDAGKCASRQSFQ
jgi:hypothetical protein